MQGYALGVVGTTAMLRTARQVRQEVSLLAFLFFAVLGTAVPIMIAQQREINACIEAGPRHCRISAIRGH